MKEKRGGEKSGILMNIKGCSCGFDFKFNFAIASICSLSAVNHEFNIGKALTNHGRMFRTCNIKTHRDGIDGPCVVVLSTFGPLYLTPPLAISILALSS